MKPKMTGILAGAMLAITAAMPASATVSNTNGQHLIGEQQSTLLLAADEGERLNGPNVASRVRGLPLELKYKIMEYMAIDTYNAVKRSWGLPNATPEEQEKMQQNKDDHRMEKLIEAFTKLSIEDD